jgi:hypothetical protein
VRGFRCVCIRGCFRCTEPYQRVREQHVERARRRRCSSWQQWRRRPRCQVDPVESYFLCVSPRLCGVRGGRSSLGGGGGGSACRVRVGCGVRVRCVRLACTSCCWRLARGCAGCVCTRFSVCSLPPPPPSPTAPCKQLCLVPALVRVSVCCLHQRKGVAERGCARPCTKRPAPSAQHPCGCGSGARRRACRCAARRCASGVFVQRCERARRGRRRPRNEGRLQRHSPPQVQCTQYISPGAAPSTRGCTAMRCPGPCPPAKRRGGGPAQSASRVATTPGGRPHPHLTAHQH